MLYIMITLGGKDYDNSGWMLYYIQSNNIEKLSDKKKISNIDILNDMVKNYKVADQTPKLIKFTKLMMKKLNNIENDLYNNPFKNNNTIFIPEISLKKIEKIPYQINNDMDYLIENLNILLKNINENITLDDNNLKMNVRKVRLEDYELLEDELETYVNELESKHNHYLQQFINNLNKR